MKRIIYFILFISLSYPCFSQWEKINTPDESPADYWLEIFFLKDNPDYGWISGYGGKVLRTTDKGLTWTKSIINHADQLESIYFLNEQVGYTVSAYSEILRASSMYRTEDGGVTWKEITPDRTLSYWGCYFLDENYGVVVGGNCEGFLGFYRTNDGGKSWKMSRYFTRDTKLSDLILYPDGSGFAASSGEIWKTKDKGVNWEIISNTGPNDWHEELCILGNSFLVPSGETCNGTIEGLGGARFSTNNGQTWNVTTLPTPQYGAFLISETEGWICGIGKSVYHTKDAGANWTIRNCGIDDANLDDFYFFNDSTGFVVGEGVYKLSRIDTLKPVIISDKRKICEGASAILTSEKEYPNYLWSTGEITRSIEVSVPGDYYMLTNTNDCNRGTSNHIQISFFDNPKTEFNIPSNYKLCEGDTVNVQIIGKLNDFVWYDGSKDYEKDFYQTGTYYLTITDTNGCTGLDSLVIEVVPLPHPAILTQGSMVLCTGQKLRLYIEGAYSEILWYNDLSGEIIAEDTNSIFIDKSGTYSVIVKSLDYCPGPADTINVSIKNDSNQLSINYNITDLPFMIDSAKYGYLPCKALEITNKSYNEAVIEYGFLKINKDFSVPPAQFPIIIQPNDKAYMVICYTPSALGKQLDTLILYDVCTSHLAQIEGFGLPDIDTITTKCGLDVMLGTKGMNSYVYFSTGYPSPSPAIDLVKVDFHCQYESSSPIVKINAIDLYGNKREIPFNKSISNSTQNSENGSLLLNIDDLFSGFYILELSVNSNSIYYKIVKQ